MNIAVIPARGGSKRIPKKNIKQFFGKPMIAWAIEAALSSGLFDRVIVSTDDNEIAEVAKKWGADVPFLRPASLANDYIGTSQVISHAVNWALLQEYYLEAVCCIYATAPFISKKDMNKGFQILSAGGWDFSFSATEFPSPIFRSFKKDTDGGVQMFFSEYYDKRSQDLPLALHDAAQFYWGTTQAWLECKPIFDRHSSPVLIPRWRVQDIDTPDDWTRAELLAPIIFNHKDF